MKSKLSRSLMQTAVLLRGKAPYTGRKPEQLPGAQECQRAPCKATRMRSAPENNADRISEKKSEWIEFSDVGVSYFLMCIPETL